MDEFLQNNGFLIVTMVQQALLAMSLYYPLMAGQLSLASPGFYALGIDVYTTQQKNPLSWFKERKPIYKIGKTFYVFKAK